MHRTRVPSSLPVVGSTLRVGPTRNDRPAAGLWRFWTAGDEIYSLRRWPGLPAARFSFHFSGQIHFKVTGEPPKLLARPLTLGEGKWWHFLEWRFLLSRDALLPEPIKLKPKEKAYLIEVPEGAVLLLNLLATVERGATPELPGELLGGQVLWRTKLRSGQLVNLLARVQLESAENCERARYIRHELGIRIAHGAPPVDAYSELTDIHWGPGGNVINVLPMWPESHRA